jgi:1-acyl-sn-glycerol-3-phosphate acyltransferase
VLRLYFRRICGIRAAGVREPAGAFIISMNHRSALDMLLYVALFERPIRFLAKAELFRIPLLGRLLRRWAIPIERGTPDRSALTQARAALDQGFALSVFPQGHRSRVLGPGHGGAVYLAAKSGVPVLPGAISGRYRPVGHLTVRTGPLLWVPPAADRVARREASLELMARIRSLTEGAAS